MRNQHIIRENFGVYSIIEPGDGTRYTAIYIPRPDNDEDNIYIAIGSGPYIRMGYFMRKSSLRALAGRIYDAAKDKIYLPGFLRDDHYTGYWNSHTFGNQDWTCSCAVLYGLVNALSPAQEDNDLSIGLIGDVYNSRHLQVVATLAEWGITPDGPR